MPNLRSLTRRLTYADIASTLCLFMLLGGSAYAAVKVTGKNVENGSLTGADVKDHSLRSRDFRRGELPRGPKGARGPAGPPGVAVPPAEIRRPVGRLTLPGITGGGPAGTIEVRSLAWSSTLNGDPFAKGGGVTPKLAWGEVAITKPPDRSSPQLWKLTATGQHLVSAKLELLAQGASTPYASYALKNVTATTFSTHGSGAERRDEVGLSFTGANPVFAFDSSAPLERAVAPRVGQMTVDGIPGTTDLVLDAWSVAQAGSAQFGPFVVSKSVDASSAGLLSRFAAGAHIKSVTIKLLMPGSESVYSTYVLTDAVMTSFAVVGDGRPLERIGFEAAKIESTTPVAGGAPVRSCFDRLLKVSC